MKHKTSFTKAFTIPELSIVITVIAILLSVSIVAYGTWRKQVATTETQSDLSNLLSTMESARNFGNGYPTAIPSDYSASDTVAITYVSGDADSFCVESQSTLYDDIRYFVEVTNGSGEVTRGTCLGGVEYDAQYTAFVYDLNLPGCVGTTVQLPVYHPSTGSNTKIIWGDGLESTLTNSNQAHTYAAKGEYTVLYEGPMILVDTTYIADDARGCLSKVTQWSDDASPTLMRFRYSTNITYVAEPPTSVTNMSNAFERATQFNQPIGDWDMSRITNIQRIFASATSFNQPIGDWDVSNVTNMNGVFDNAAVFNQPIDSWDVSSVTNLDNTFTGAAVFNQPLNSWDTSSVTSMVGTFGKHWCGCPGARSFNQPLNNWDVSNVTNMDAMFQAAESFNQNIDNWDVSNVTNMRAMFDAGIADSASSFNQPLNSWNTSKVTNMAAMFGDARQFNQPLGNWDVSKVGDFGSMFDESAFNQPLNTWNTASATSFWRMFRGTNYNHPLNNWNTSNVRSMYQMFGSNNVYNQNLTGWNTSSVIDTTASDLGGPASWTLRPPLPTV